MFNKYIKIHTKVKILLRQNVYVQIVFKYCFDTGLIKKYQKASYLRHLSTFKHTDQKSKLNRN